MPDLPDRGDRHRVRGALIPTAAVLAPLPGKLRRELASLTWRGPPARTAAAAVLSVWLALLVGRALHVQDSYWAAFSGFMVLRASAEQSVLRSALRLVGTAAGAALAVAAAPLVAGADWRVSLVMLPVVGVTLWLSLTARFSYAWLLAGITFVLVTTDTLTQPSPAWGLAIERIEAIRTEFAGG